MSKKRKALTNICNISFLNKGVKLTRVFRSVMTGLPIDIKFDNSTVVYSLINPMRSKIFNFSRLVNKLNSVKK